MKKEDKSNEIVDKELEEKMEEYWAVYELYYKKNRGERIAMGKKMKKLMKGKE